MSSNAEFKAEIAAVIPVASDATKKRLFLDVSDGNFKTKDSSGTVAPLAGAGGGGAGALTLVDSPQNVPIKTAMVVMDDVEIVNGGDLKVEGDLVSARTVDNFSVLRIPPRGNRVVQENDELLFTDDMVIDGVLTVDGMIRDVTPYGLPDLLYILGTNPSASRAAIGAAAQSDLVLVQAQLDDSALTGTVQTTNATPATIATYATLANNRVVTLHAKLMARDNIDDFVGHWVAEVTIKRDSVGTVTVLEDLIIKSYKDNAAWDIQFNVSGININIAVIGDVAQTVEWRLIGSASEHG